MICRLVIAQRKISAASGDSGTVVVVGSVGSQSAAGKGPPEHAPVGAGEPVGISLTEQLSMQVRTGEASEVNVLGSRHHGQ
jgi:hypothetical protein